MVDKLKVINFLQDYGCARLSHLQILFNDKNNNFKNILTSNIASKKNDIFVYNNCKIDEQMLAALDVLCKYNKRFSEYHLAYRPAYITFLTKDNIQYHIIVAGDSNEIGVVKRINNPHSFPEADRFIVLFKSLNQLNNINCSKPYVYCTYPNIKKIKQVL